jgi:DNA polymerase-3 subunit delta'
MDPFFDILGHDRAKARLNHALASERMHHAWLFAGRAGIGKRKVALRVAQMLNCERGAPPVAGGHRIACGQCRHCRRIGALQHPDLLVVAPDGKQIKIEQVRELSKRLVYSPFEAPWRVIIVEDAHLLGIEAANALLKTLEEPPERNLFILLTDQAQRLLPTILSRCMTLRFGPFPVADVRTWLEKQGIGPERAVLAAALSDGSFGRAAHLASDGQMEVFQETLHTLRRICGRRDASAAMTLASQLAADRDLITDYLFLAQIYLRDLALLSTASPHAPSPTRLILAPLASDLAQDAQSLDLERLERALKAVQTTIRALDGNVNPQVALESLLLSLAALRPAATTTARART